ncbi:hypothetical protein M427DRAFT_52573 [Gonapodya prolifera JEL478]|uniref:Uncharacterized protein n=1 Tax=Gonapodya prolifera (strain JEL478) TaxID=1344416 RepID=A0A139ASJ1_GONPJ|nr:hypothetical protein M427DRAFT_52573 [Gonapodya prolifera JEL478]|eukprot:KXS19669.1 hypothetical protein M427DRAFT_52573 [Gonapodya prolifera JEL478]
MCLDLGRVLVVVVVCGWWLWPLPLYLYRDPCRAALWCQRAARGGAEYMRACTWF